MTLTAGHRPSSSTPTPTPTPTPTTGGLVDVLQEGLVAPICLTWELTYGCNLACVHCLSSSGRRDPRELDTAQCTALIDEFAAMGVFYLNVGGGEPTIRPDFWRIVDHALDRGVGMKFSTNGSRIDATRARWIVARPYLDVQVSLDGATAAVNDAVRGQGSYATAIRALENLAEAGARDVKISVVCTRDNIGQLDDFALIAQRYSAMLRLTRLRPSGRGATSWHALHPRPEQQRELYDWLLRAGDRVLTGDSFFHLSGFGQPLPGLNLCGAGRVVCLVDPVGDVYACPFAIHEHFLAGNVVAAGFAAIWRDSPTFTALRVADGGTCTACPSFSTCRGGCRAAKFFTGLPEDGPDPECVRADRTPTGAGAVPVAIGPRPVPDKDHSRGSARACADHPLAGWTPPTAGFEVAFPGAAATTTGGASRR
ncbi:MAG: mycofactocin radical SAM maturase [Austwickia sp.]|nr:mycofactocin radical SAM maturase [Austwickia sp.]MBK8437887.1 mycofactocin radical SAM maturase [Austwickia sp.]MBK9100188.1 mycofactocin radical SAM maturase [Austwickia sp.]